MSSCWLESSCREWLFGLRGDSGSTGQLPFWCLLPTCQSSLLCPLPAKSSGRKKKPAYCPCCAQLEQGMSSSGVPATPCLGQPETAMAIGRFFFCAYCLPTPPRCPPPAWGLQLCPLSPSWSDLSSCLDSLGDPDVQEPLCVLSGQLASACSTRRCENEPPHPSQMLK